MSSTPVGLTPRMHGLREVLELCAEHEETSTEQAQKCQLMIQCVDRTAGMSDRAGVDYLWRVVHSSANRRANQLVCQLVANYLSGRTARNF